MQRKLKDSFVSMSCLFYGSFLSFTLSVFNQPRAMRPKARGLALHGRCDFVHGFVPLASSVPYRLPWHELPTCELMEWYFQLLLYSKCTQPSVMSYVTQERHGLVLYIKPMPSLCRKQWYRRLEGLPNKTARLAGWRRVTKQGVILCDGRSMPPIPWWT